MRKNYLLLHICQRNNFLSNSTYLPSQIVDRDMKSGLNRRLYDSRFHLTSHFQLFSNAYHFLLFFSGYSQLKWTKLLATKNAQFFQRWMKQKYCGSVWGKLHERPCNAKTILTTLPYRTNKRIFHPANTWSISFYLRVCLYLFSSILSMCYMLMALFCKFSWQLYAIILAPTQANIVNIVHSTQRLNDDSQPIFRHRRNRAQFWNVCGHHTEETKGIKQAGVGWNRATFEKYVGRESNRMDRRRNNIRALEWRE